MSISQVTTRDTQLEKQRIGKPQLSLTNFSNTLEPAIAAGSVIEVGGSLYTVTVDEAITGWAGIGNDTDCYIKMVPGSPMTAAFVTAAPTWSHAKQGWYVSNDRYVAVIHRGASAAAYEDKGIIPGVQENTFSALDIARDLTVGGDADISGNLTVTVDMKASRGYIPQHTLYGASVTEETIFDAMSPAIPDNGDIIAVWGGVGAGGNLTAVAYAKRNTATEIYFYGVLSSGTASYLSIIEDDAGTREVALAW